MKPYDERMLTLLMDKYERSLLYTGENKKRQTIAVAVDKKHFKEYYSETSMEYEVLHEQMKELEHRGFVQLVWKRGKENHILEKCVLVPEKADEIYRYLGRKPLADQREAILNICSRQAGRALILDRFLQWIMVRIQQHETVGEYCRLDDPERFEQLCEITAAIENNWEELFLREFSVRYFHDSKAVEGVVTEAARILRDFSVGRENASQGDETIPDLQGLTTDEILEEFHIYRNPSWTYLKGTGVFRVCSDEREIRYSNADNGFVNLSGIPGGLGLSDADLLNLDWMAAGVSIVPKKVITIENLTTFHRFREEGALIIYLAGYHNRVKREFLRNLYKAFGDSCSYEHYGDIDVGGFKIWKDLCQKTGIPFQTKYMDMEIYRKYRDTGRELTKKDREELGRMCEDSFYSEQRELFWAMLQDGKKVEQEVVIINAK